MQLLSQVRRTARRRKRAQSRIVSLIASARTSETRNGFYIQDPAQLTDRIASALHPWLQQQITLHQLRGLTAHTIRNSSSDQTNGEPTARGYFLAGSPETVARKLFEHLFGTAD